MSARRGGTRWRGVPVVGAVIAVVVLVSTALAGPSGVSPTPFGIPNDRRPEPGARRSPRSAATGAGTGREQTRSEVLARHGVVATSQPIAAQAGLQVLKDGGNAADAAVTTAAMLGVVEPESAGIGGDMEAIYYSAADHKLYGLNAAGWAPASATPAFYHQNGYDEVPAYGVFSATVPGAVDGWARFLNRFGTISLADALQPSIETARQGFGLTERIRGDWESYHGFYVDMLKQDPESNKVFLRNGNVPPLYSIFRNPDLAKAYELIAENGPSAFYDGPIGQAIVNRMNQDGADWKLSDLSTVQVAVGRPHHHQLQGLRRLRDAAADPGVRNARDAEHPRAVRGAGGLRPARARSAFGEVLEHPRAGEAARVRRPAEVQRRSALRERAGEQADLEVVRGIAVRPDPSEHRTATADDGGVEVGTRRCRSPRRSAATPCT